MHSAKQQFCLIHTYRHLEHVPRATGARKPNYFPFEHTLGLITALSSLQIITILLTAKEIVDFDDQLLCQQSRLMMI